MDTFHYEEFSPPQRRFVDNLDSNPNYGKEKQMGQFGPKEEALLTANYIQLPTAKYPYLGVDLDYGGAIFFSQELNYPAPTIAMTNPANGHANLFWELEAPVIKPCSLNHYRAKEWPVTFFKNVLRGYRKAFRGDKGYTCTSIKNPFSPLWLTVWNDYRYSLKELAEYVDVTAKPKQQIEKDDFAGRNCELFYAGRMWAYKAVFRYPPETFEQNLYEYCHEYNNQTIPVHWPDKGPLPKPEVDSIVFHIAPFVLKGKEEGKFKQQLKNIGAMKLPKLTADLSNDEKAIATKCRQAQGAAYAHLVCKGKTEDKIIKAIHQFHSEGRDLVKKEVAILAGVSRATLRRYKHLF